MRKLCMALMLLLTVHMFCGCSLYQSYKERRAQEMETYKKNQIGEILRIDLSDCELIEYWNNLTGMSDGNTLTVFTLSENALLRLYALIEEQKSTGVTVWHSLPFSEQSLELVYSSGYFYNWKEEKNALPYVGNGYWWSDVASGDKEEVTVAENFDFSLFDADMGVLYYYEYDS